MKRIRVRFLGRVQGVGFRYTTQDIASAHDVTGYVKNEMNGSVTLVAEGEARVLEALLKTIRCSRLGGTIIDEERSWSEAQGDMNGFSIRY